MRTFGKIFRVPSTMLAIASMVFIPASFASAHEQGNNPIEGQRIHQFGVPFEIESITINDDGSGTMQGSLERVPEQLTEETGVTEGDAVTITFTSDTRFVLNHAEVTVEDFNEGDVAFAAGIPDMENMTVDARVITDKPFPPKRHIGEVIEVDTDANTILVKAIGQEDEDAQYAYVTYDSETSFREDGEEADESAISVGDKIHVQGTFNFESDEYVVEIDAQTVSLFDEELPPRAGHPGHGGRPAPRL